MKPTLFALALLAVPFSAHALDLNGPMTCTLHDGSQILVNDDFAGGRGKAIYSKSPRSQLRVTPQGEQDGFANLMIDKGTRAYFPDFVLRLNLAQAEVTTRKEGNDNVEYVFIPATSQTSSLTAGKSVQDAKCLQLLN